MQNSPLPEHVRDALNIVFKIGTALGRKFEREDMTIELRRAAVLYAATYQCRPEGDDFMRDMQANASGGAFLSDGQAKGVLNVLMADARRRLAARTSKAPSASAVGASAPTAARAILANVPDGRYRVTLPSGEHLALYIKLAGQDSKLAGSRVVSTRINGDDWMGVAHIAPQGDLRLWRSCAGALRDRVRDAINVLDAAETQDQWLVAGLAFAQEGSQCFFCGRDLDTPESLLAGYGPTCADKHGLPWGAKAIPMSVRLAQATAAQAATPAAPAIDPKTGVEETADELLDLAAQAAPSAATPTQKEAAPAWKSPVSLTEARNRGYSRTYEEIFGEDAL